MTEKALGAVQAQSAFPALGAPGPLPGEMATCLGEREECAVQRDRRPGSVSRGPEGEGSKLSLEGHRAGGWHVRQER